MVDVSVYTVTALNAVLISFTYIYFCSWDIFNMLIKSYCEN